MTRTETHAAVAAPVPPGSLGVGARLRSWWRAVSAVVGALLGLAPHVLHHVGLLAGTALLVGTEGTLLFGVFGFLASVPMLLRLRRRFATWWAPAVGVTVFVAAFSLSAFVIGPAINDTGSGSGGGPSPTQVVDHEAHHGG